MTDEVIRRLVHTTKELRILKAINKIVHSTDNLAVLVSRVVGIIHKELKVGLAFIILENEGKLDVINYDEKRPLHPEFLELVHVMTEDTIKRDSPIFIRHTRANTRLANFGIASSISAPLMSYTGPIGAIVIMTQSRNLGLESFKIINSIANLTASTVQHIWLRQAVMEKEKKIVSLYSKLYGKEARKAIIDELTGLFNKRYFVEILEKEFEKGKTISLIIFDLDFFKSYNDRYGHVEGDRLLQNIGKVVQKRCKKKYRACRYGGEEFAVLANSFEDAVKLAENLRQDIESFYPKKAKRNITASFGVGKKKAREKKEIFVDRVDKALYKAKKMGRNTVWTS